MMTQKSVQRGIENKKQTRVPRAFKIRVLEGGNARKIFKNVFLHLLEIDAGDHIDLQEF